MGVCVGVCDNGTKPVLDGVHVGVIVGVKEIVGVLDGVGAGGKQSPLFKQQLEQDRLKPTPDIVGGVQAPLAQIITGYLPFGGFKITV